MCKHILTELDPSLGDGPALPAVLRASPAAHAEEVVAV